MIPAPFACRCPRWSPDTCERRMTQEDFLCDVCRTGCSRLLFASGLSADGVWSRWHTSKSCSNGPGRAGGYSEDTHKAWQARLGMLWHGRARWGPARLGRRGSRRGFGVTPAEKVELLVGELRVLLVKIEALLPEPVEDATTGTMRRNKVSGSPAPWHAEAGAVLMNVHAGVRDLEVDLKYTAAGTLPEGRWPAHRTGADAHTAAALDAIVRLAYGVPDDAARRARDQLDAWIRQAREIRDIGEAEPWEPIHVPRGQLPPTCPYCTTFSLRVALRSGLVGCSNPICVDSNGDRPRGRIDKNRLDGSAMLVWADGRTIYYGEAS